MSEKFDNPAYQTLQEWNRIYAETLIDELKPTGDVLEVGFGQGFAANQVQKFHPKTHTIIEKDSTLAQAAKKWAQNHSNVIIIQDSWQNALPELGLFDSVFFNGNVLDKELEILQRLRPADINFATTQTSEVLKEIEQELAKFDINFSDEQIDDFFKNVDHTHEDKLSTFFSKLRERGQITQKQYDNTLKKYHLKKQDKQDETSTFSDELYPFLEQCLEGHMKKGSRFSAFLNNLYSKYQDTIFFDNIISNPAIEYQEKLVTIKAPKNTIDGIVMLLTKIK